MGCVMQVGEQSTNVARNAVLASKLPESVPGTSVDRQCGSSQQALHFAAQAVMSGTMDMVIAAGVESMTRVPMGLPVRCRPRTASASRRARASEERYPEHRVQPVHRRRDDRREVRPDQGPAGQLRATTATSAPSPRPRAARSRTRSSPSTAWTPTAQTVSYTTATRASASTPAWKASRGVKLLREGGRITAATASQICDGASRRNGGQRAGAEGATA